MKGKMLTKVINPGYLWREVVEEAHGLFIYLCTLFFGFVFAFLTRMSRA